MGNSLISADAYLLVQEAWGFMSNLEAPIALQNALENLSKKMV